MPESDSWGVMVAHQKLKVIFKNECCFFLTSYRILSIIIMSWKQPFLGACLYSKLFLFWIFIFESLSNIRLKKSLKEYTFLPCENISLQTAVALKRIVQLINTFMAK